ncbi:MAG TPA: hypothetical protein VK338_01080 [Candidatus Nitrosocosmicus sp.]|nr:hypothetical protein [Candidatus Nitrosocosmicus sp.]
MKYKKFETIIAIAEYPCQKRIIDGKGDDVWMKYKVFIQNKEHLKEDKYD